MIPSVDSDGVVDLSGLVVAKLTALQPCGRRMCDTQQRAPHVWLCRCECGEHVRRSARALLRAYRTGNPRKMLCGKCLDASRIAREKWRHEAYLAYWLKMGSLWSDNAVIRLTENIRRAVRSAYGMPDHRYDGPTAVSDAEVWTPPMVDRYHGYGSRDRDGATLAHIGKVLGISRERVRQIEREAIYKLAVGLYRVDPDLFGGKMPNHRDITEALARKEDYDRAAAMRLRHLAQAEKKRRDGEAIAMAQDAADMDEDALDMDDEDRAAIDVEALYDGHAA